MHIIIAVVTLTVNLIKIQVLSNPIKKKTTEKLDKHNKNNKHPLRNEKRIRKSKYPSNCLTEYFRREKEEIFKCHY